MHMPSSPQAQGMNMRSAARGVLISMLINVVPTLIIFVLLKNVAHTSDMAALLLSGVPAIAYSLLGIIRQRKIDFFSGFMLFVIIIGIIFLLIGGDPRFYLLRMSLISLSIGLAYMVSLLFPKPLWFYVGRYFLTGNDPQNVANYDQQWQYPYFRFAMRIMSLFWGVVTLIATAIQVILVLTFPLGVFLAVSPLLDGILWLVLLGWTGWFLRRMSKRLSTLKSSENMPISLKPATS